MKRTLTLGTLLAVLSITAGVALLLTSCSTIQKALNIENPRYSLRDIRPRVDIALPLSASSIDIDFNLFINESRVLDSISQQDIRIPANGRGNVALRTRIGYDNIRSLWNEMVDVVRGQRAKYEIRGDAYYQTPVGRLKFPVTVYSTR
ncbi:MAG TPA: LEA type 2 family protein [Thermoanaerobaculia bacterium]|nr:LEA type 2 family protein [Thermoanaerobaculia bacterium]